MTHRHAVQIYYEDTDLSGVVYHANYLRYFERAREHLLGVEELVRLWNEDGIGFVVYKCAMTFKEGASLGDLVEIRTDLHLESEYRIRFAQNAWRIGRAGHQGPHSMGTRAERSAVGEGAPMDSLHWERGLHQAPSEAKLLVEGSVELVCVDASKSLCRLPGGVVERLTATERS